MRSFHMEFMAYNLGEPYLHLQFDKELRDPFRWGVATPNESEFFNYLAVLRTNLANPNQPGIIEYDETIESFTYNFSIQFPQQHKPLIRTILDMDVRGSLNEIANGEILKDMSGTLLGRMGKKEDPQQGTLSIEGASTTVPIKPYTLEHLQ